MHSSWRTRTTCSARVRTATSIYIGFSPWLTAWCAPGRKIIFTTNLPNIGDIDEALVRPGQCFCVLRTRPLTLGEVERLLSQVLADVPERQATLARLFRESVRAVTLAEIYWALEQP
jgi:hypothetical protein